MGNRDPKAPSCRRTEFRPSRRPEGVAAVTISNDLHRLGFIRTDPHPTVCIQEVAPDAREVEHREEHSRSLSELSWNPAGTLLASIQEIGSTPARRMLTWRDPVFERLSGWFDVHSYAWSPDGRSIVIADHGERKLRRLAADEEAGEPSDLAPLDDDGDPLLAPWIAPCPDGRRVVYSSRRAREGVTDLRLDGEVLTEIPGVAVQAAPFWSADGRSLGVHLVHLEEEKSAILIVPDLKGDGEILYARNLVDLPGPGAWSPSGHSIAFFRTATPKHDGTRSGDPELVLLDVRTGELSPLTEPGEMAGRPRFLDGSRLVVDGGRAAHLFEFARPV
jgi:Tol biopolymer transport system component